MSNARAYVYNNSNSKSKLAFPCQCRHPCLIFDRAIDGSKPCCWSLVVMSTWSRDKTRLLMTLDNSDV